MAPDEQRSWSGAAPGLREARHAACVLIARQQGAHRASVRRRLATRRGLAQAQALLPAPPSLHPQHDRARPCQSQPQAGAGAGAAGVPLCHEAAGRAGRALALLGRGAQPAGQDLQVSVTAAPFMKRVGGSASWAGRHARLEMGSTGGCSGPHLALLVLARHALPCAACGSTKRRQTPLRGGARAAQVEARCGRNMQRSGVTRCRLVALLVQLGSSVGWRGQRRGAAGMRRGQASVHAAPACCHHDAGCLRPPASGSILAPSALVILR